ncbi:MAG: DUF4105 domain-containing protein [Planctomycetota bacterium]
MPLPNVVAEAIAFRGGDLRLTMTIHVSPPTRPPPGSSASSSSSTCSPTSATSSESERATAQELYLYPARYTVEEARTFLRGILNRVNQIRERPVFYNAITENCLTSMIPICKEIRRDPPRFDIRVLLNGHLDEFAYEIGRLVADASHGLPVDEMRRKHVVSPTVKRLPDDANFSKNLRAQLPRRTR